jgi:hypothetical protein
MLRLQSDSSRSYPGRPARRWVVLYGSALCGNIQGDRSEVSRGHSRRRKLPLMVAWLMETIPANRKAGRSHPAEGPKPKYGE